jgi:hypothetical protein
MSSDNPRYLLYSYFYKCVNKNKEVEYNIVKKYIDDGAKLNGSLKRDGYPLILAIEIMVHPSILKLIVDFGGVDWNYKTYENFSIYKDNSCICNDYPECNHPPPKLFDDSIVIYYSLKNMLLLSYHSFYGSVKLINQCIIEYNNYYSHITNIKNDLFDEELEKEPVIENSEKYIEYLKEYCKILNINYDSLKNMSLDLPENIRDFSNIPVDSELYI